jgi:hypothetical protein
VPIIFFMQNYNILRVVCMFRVNGQAPQLFKVGQIIRTTAARINCARVARWFIFKPKIPIWVNFGGPWNG